MSSSNDDTNRVMNRVMELKRSLEKSVKSDDMSAGYVLDQLCALEKLDLGANIITDSKLGKVLLNLKKKFTDVSEDVCNKAKDIMVEWKRIIETHKERSTPSSSALASGQGQPQQPKVPSVAVGAGSGDPEKPKAEANPPRAATSTAPTPKQSQILSLDSSAMLVFASLPEPRKKVISLLADHIKLSGAVAATAETVAFRIESAINDAISFDIENKAYMAKVRSLSFNIKQNESLRADLVNGELTPELLVKLTPEDLATEKLRKARQATNRDERDSRRTDWLEENKDKIQEKLGLDPTNVWEYSEEEMSDPD